MRTGDGGWRLPRAFPRLAAGLAALVALAAAGCSGPGTGDSSPIPSTGVPEAARGARGIRVADHATPIPSNGTPDESFETDPYGNPIPPGVPIPTPPKPAVPPTVPPDPFGAPPSTPSGAPLVPPPPPPKPPSTGVPL